MTPTSRPPARRPTAPILRSGLGGRGSVQPRRHATNEASRPPDHPSRRPDESVGLTDDLSRRPDGPAGLTTHPSRPPSRSAGRPSHPSSRPTRPDGRAGGPRGGVKSRRGGEGRILDHGGHADVP